jgi:hypothetical protein
MSDLIFHVYKDDKVKAHNLTADELETLIHSKQVKLGEDEILPLELSKNTEGSLLTEALYTGYDFIKPLRIFHGKRI